MQLRFAHEGTEYSFDNSLSLAEAMMIKSATDLTAGQFLSGIGQMDAEALAGMVLLAKIRNGEDTVWSDLASMDIVKLIESVGELNQGDPEDEDEQDEAEDRAAERASVDVVKAVQPVPINGSSVPDPAA